MHSNELKSPSMMACDGDPPSGRPGRPGRPPPPRSVCECCSKRGGALVVSGLIGSSCVKRGRKDQGKGSRRRSINKNGDIPKSRRGCATSPDGFPSLTRGDSHPPVHTQLRSLAPCPTASLPPAAGRTTQRPADRPVTGPHRCSGAKRPVAATGRVSRPPAPAADQSASLSCR